MNTDNFYNKNIGNKDSANELSNTLFIDRLKFVEYLRLSQLVIDKKTDAETSKINFVLTKNSVSLYSSDNLISFKVSLAIPNEMEESFALSINILYHLARKLDDKNICFVVQSNYVTIKYNSGYLNLIRLDTDSINSHQEECTAFLYYNSSDLSDKIRSIKSTIASEDIRKQFTGVICVAENNNIILWSTDAHKLSLNSLDICSSAIFSNIWPRKFIECISSISNQGLAKIEIYDRAIGYKIDGIEIFSQLINDVHVINYKDILKDNVEPTIKIKLDVIEFTKKLERIMIIADESSRVYLLIENQLSIGCNNAKNGSTQEFLYKAECDSEKSIKIYFNGIYVLAFLKNFKDFAYFSYYSQSNTIIISKDTYPIYMTKAMKERRIEY